MASLGNPKAWVPYMKTKDCSQGFCSLYCPQWCYTMFTPPPPPFVFKEDNSGPSFSPLVIAIIGILASAFLLVSYYAIISKYCGNRRDPSSTTENHHVPDEEELEESTQDPSNHETWYVSNNGLDEALIKSITVCKYKKGGGLIELTDCSVCLGEFQEDESLRLLPKCSHAFHVNCIDTWLKSHSNCPLCRASIGFVNPTPVFLPPPPPPPFLYDDSDSDSSQVLEMQGPCAINHSSERLNNNAFPPPPPSPPLIYDDSDTDSSQSLEWHDPQLVNCSLERRNGNAACTDIGARDEDFTTMRASSDFENLMEGDSIIEIREEQGRQQIRRSVSMNHSCEAHLSLADVLFINQDEEFQFHQMEECRVEGEVGSSKGGIKGMIKFRNRNRVLSCVFSRPLAIKRSFSSGRLFTRRGRM